MIKIGRLQYGFCNLTPGLLGQTYFQGSICPVWPSVSEKFIFRSHLAYPLTPN